MARKTKSSASEPDNLPIMPPAYTPEDQEQQMISLSYNLAEKQLREGTASSQVITHFLKLGSMREQVELEKLKRENELLKAKTNAIHSQERSEDLFQQALYAIKKYSGGEDDD